MDSLIGLLQSITATQAVLEFQPSFQKGLTIATNVGLLIGALFWGLTADVIGRRFAFNTSLLLSSVFAILAGTATKWEVLGLWAALSGFGSGGNLVLDTTVFLEVRSLRSPWIFRGVITSHLRCYRGSTCQANSNGF